jgi:hypothetical protein
MYNSSFARLVTNLYEIFYDRTRKMWAFNTGDFFIEVTTRAVVIVHVYTIISRVSIIYGSWMFWHFLLIAGCSLALKAKDDTRLHYTYIVEVVHCDTRVFQHPHVCPVLHVSLCTSTSPAGADPGFQVRGGAHLKQLRRAGGGAKILGYFVWKITILRQKIIFFPN